MTGWDATLATGNPVVDAVHRHLQELLEIVDRATPRQRQKLVTPRLLRDLYKQFEGLFAAEHALMRDCGYDRQSRHEIEHKAMLSTLAQLIDQFDENCVNMAINFLEKWLASHLKAEDRPLAEFIRQRPPRGGG